MKNSSTMAAAIGATVHCLTGCAIGEILGLIIGTAFGLTNLTTIALSTALAFVIGYTLSIRPILKFGLGLKAALLLVLAADSLSILSMEIADNTVMAIVPGAMNAGLANPLFWAIMPVSLLVGFIVAVPVNDYLLKRGKGMALTHKYHGHQDHKEA